MKTLLNNKKGMLVLALSIGLIVVATIFASLFNRMRNEAMITNRVSINERLNQLASAIGRLSIRKLQKDIELRTPRGEKILTKIVSENKFCNSTSSNPSNHTNHITDDDEDFTTYIFNPTVLIGNTGMTVMTELNKQLKETWGEKGGITKLDVDLDICLGPQSPFSPPIAGVTPIGPERRGYVDVHINLELANSGVVRHYIVRKEFYLVRLLAAPFYRFTLFSHKGAGLDDRIANAFPYNDLGEPTESGKRPLVCINKNYPDKTLAASILASIMPTPDYEKAFNYVENADKVINGKADNFIKNGWIYLGGEGKSCDKTDKYSKDKLMLNVVPGSEDDDLKKQFGEFFHFYFNEDNGGWAIIDSWSEKFKQWIPGNSDGGKVKLSTVNYGFFKGIFNYKDDNNNILFTNTIPKMYGEFTEENQGDICKAEKGSALHLFGTPKRCTPTLIFGNVHRRYLRTFSLYYEDKETIYPLRVATHAKPNQNNLGIDDINDLSIGSLYIGNIPSTYIQLFNSDGNDEAISDFSTALSLGLRNNLYEGKSDQDIMNIYYNGIPSEGLNNGLGPIIIDEEPYMNALLNISSPTDPSKEWNQVVPDNVFCKNNAEDLCVQNFKFEYPHESESRYVGEIEKIKIDYDEYLRDRSTFTLTANEGGCIKFSDNKFIQDHFLSNDGDFHLNQIIRINGDLIIDKEIKVSQGGIIISNGKITINKPIINKYNKEGILSGNPNAFGYLTLIAKKGIEIDSSSFHKSNTSPLKRLEAFLIAGCDDIGDGKIILTQQTEPIHIVGGVCADKFEDLITSGSIIEWGLRPDGGVNDYSQREYYGFTLGPRDIEIYYEN